MIEANIITRRDVLAAAGASAALTIAGCSAEQSDDSDSSDDADDSEKDTYDDPQWHEYGESALLEERSMAAEYTVNDVQVVPNIGPYDTNESFLVVDVSVRNTGNESFRFSSRHLKVVNRDMQEYDIDTSATYATRNPLQFEQINPGVTKAGEIAYEIPRKTAGYFLKITTQQVFTTAEPQYLELGEVEF